MANQIKVGVLLNLILDGELSPQPLFNKPSVQFDQAGNGLTAGLQTVGTSAEVLNVANNGTLGLGVVFNTDSTNFVQLGWDDTGFVASDKIPPRRFCLKWFDPSRIWQAKADTASVILQIAILDV